MKLTLLGAPERVMQAPAGMRNYFAWPTVARLRDGRIAVGASGFRKRHVCPYGKAVVSYSNDEGRSYTPPIPVIDTVLDDRDCGIAPFGENGMIVTSFNNTVEFQRHHTTDAADLSHLDKIDPSDEARDLGVTFRFSTDGGAHFGPLYKSPVGSPHGPVELSDGTILWLGRTFSKSNTQMEDDCLKAYILHLDGNCEYRGEIENVDRNRIRPLSCEPHVIQLANGDLLAHIRVQDYKSGLYTTYQSRSLDFGKTWSSPAQILSDCGGAPAHLIRHSSGILFSVYGYRGSPLATPPFGIRVLFSTDDGNTWASGGEIYSNTISHDLGYPSTVELSDGTLLTVFYAIHEANTPATILQQKWRFEL